MIPRTEILIKFLLPGFCLISCLCSIIIPINVKAEPRVNVSVKPDKGTIDTEFYVQVTISGSDFRSTGHPVFENSEHFILESRSSSVQQQIINNQISFQKTFSYQVIFTTTLPAGEYPLPRGSLVIDDKKYRLPTKKIIIEPVTGQTQGSSSTSSLQGARIPSNQEDFSFVQVISNERPYVGEQIAYRSEIIAPPNLGRAELQDFEPQGFWRERYGEDEKSSRVRQNVTIHSFSESFYPLQAGSFEIPPRELLAEIRVLERSRSGPPGNLNDRIFGGLFPFVSQFRTVQKKITSNSINLDVRPLPPAPPNAGSYIPVGKLIVTSNIDSDELDVGDSLVLTIQVSGNANLRPLKIAKDKSDKKSPFKRYDDKPIFKKVIKNGEVIHYKTFKISLVPRTAGIHSVPVYQITWFDPVQAEYKTVSTLEKSIRVASSDKIDIHQENYDDEKNAEGDYITDKETYQPLEIKGLDEETLRKNFGKQTIVIPVSLTLFLAFLLLPLSFLLLYIDVIRKLAIEFKSILLKRNSFDLSSIDPDSSYDEHQALNILTNALKDIFDLSIKPGSTINETEVDLINAFRIKNNSTTELPSQLQDVIQFIKNVDEKKYSGINDNVEIPADKLISMIKPLSVYKKKRNLTSFFTRSMVFSIFLLFSSFGMDQKTVLANTDNNQLQDEKVFLIKLLSEGANNPDIFIRLGDLSESPEESILYYRKANNLSIFSPELQFKLNIKRKLVALPINQNPGNLSFWKYTIPAYFLPLYLQDYLLLAGCFFCLVFSILYFKNFLNTRIIPSCTIILTLMICLGRVFIMPDTFGVPGLISNLTELNKMGAVITANISVLSAPNKNAHETFVLIPGNEVDIYPPVKDPDDETILWYRIQNLDGRQGWVSTSLVNTNIAEFAFVS
ncbi:MAG TPA: BatD family protein [Oligoflexia bacterium]|nr:BatD family protein [Oligoflexia bacterium]HMP49033.1 BatD family protein [Oligoflexia bacterium]